MPLYEYVCQKCGKKTEVIQRHGDRPLRSCPECGGRVKKAISAPAIQFKGSGFYLTDYGRSGGGPKGEGAGSSEAGGGEKSDRSDKSDKSDRSDKSDKPDKSDKSDKSDKPRPAESGGGSGKGEKT